MCPSQSYSWSHKYPFMKILITNILHVLVFPPPLSVWSKYSTQYPALETTNLFCSVIGRDRFHTYVHQMEKLQFSVL
jgi:hypothetical protein